MPITWVPSESKLVAEKSTNRRAWNLLQILISAYIMLVGLVVTGVIKAEMGPIQTIFFSLAFVTYTAVEVTAYTMVNQQANLVVCTNGLSSIRGPPDQLDMVGNTFCLNIHMGIHSAL
ncbi:unnamed protein product [Orchesella dallaii]|uniref:Uncharacterized protein n=1 Tax=Orchesella dallaii TaxID=48710 RepID=A0ABP1RMM2_9HEXA